MHLKSNQTLIVCAARNMGKSVLVKSFLVMPGGLGTLYDSIIVMGNAASMDQYDFLISKKSPNRVYPEIRADVIENCYQTNLARKKKNRPLISFLIIFDDSLDNSSAHNKIINSLFAVGRHSCCTPLIIAQSLSMLSTTARRNADMFIFGKPRTDRDRIWAYENLLSTVEGVGNKKRAFEIINKMEKYQFLVVDYTSGETVCGLIKAKYIKI